MQSINRRRSWKFGLLSAFAATLSVACGSSSDSPEPVNTAGSAGSGVSAAGSSGAVAGSAGSGNSAGTPAQGGTPAVGGAGASGSPASGGGAGASGSPNGGSGGTAGAGGSGVAGGPSGGGGGLASGGSGGQGGSAGQAGAAGSSSYQPCPAKGTPCRIMPLGDSITEGYRSSAPGGGYRPPLFHLALQASQSITFVGNAPLNGPDKVDGVTFPKQNEGVGGRTIANISSVVVDSMKKNKPNIVLLGIGTNDLPAGATEMGKQLGPLLDKILAADPNVLLVVAQIIPCKTDSVNTTIRAYDALIPGLVKSRADAGKHIVTVDMYKAFTANTNYKTALLYDTYHPRDAGYSLMADVWYAAIKSDLR